MTTLSQFLEQKGREQKMVERQKRQEEWVGAVRKLLAKIRKWLNKADRDKKFLDVIEVKVERFEEGIGRYEAPALKIVFGDTMVDITPEARNAAGSVNLGDGRRLEAEGRIDVTSGLSRYILFRVIQNNKDLWYIRFPTDTFSQLDETSFEHMMLVLLS